MKKEQRERLILEDFIMQGLNQENIKSIKMVSKLVEAKADTRATGCITDKEKAPAPAPI